MSSLVNSFSRVCVLNLPSKGYRRKRLTKHLESLGISDGEVQWVRACSGEQLHPPAWWNAGNGAWGCMISHARVIQEAVLDGIESLLILEDDVIFQENAIHYLKAFMETVPRDWGQIYLGGQHLKDPEPLPGLPSVLLGNNVNRTHAYAVHKRAMNLLHQHIFNASDYIAHPQGWHLDHQLGLAHEDRTWKVYCPRMWFAGQDSEWSNISGRRNPRYWWHWHSLAEHLPFIWFPGGKLPPISTQEKALLHPGWNLRGETLSDIGLDGCIENPKMLLQWMQMISKEAIDLEKLPGLQHPEIDFQLVKSIWTTALLADEIDLSDLHHRTYNKLRAR